MKPIHWNFQAKPRFHKSVKSFEKTHCSHEQTLKIIQFGCDVMRCLAGTHWLPFRFSAKSPFWSSQRPRLFHMPLRNCSRCEIKGFLLLLCSSFSSNLFLLLILFLFYSITLFNSILILYSLFFILPFLLSFSFLFHRLHQLPILRRSTSHRHHQVSRTSFPVTGFATCCSCSFFIKSSS